MIPQDVVTAVVGGLAIAAVGGLAFVSYNHPRAYAKLADAIMKWTGVFAALILFCFAVALLQWVRVVASLTPDDCVSMQCHRIRQMAEIAETLKAGFWGYVILVLSLGVLFIPSYIRKWDTPEKPNA